MLFLFKRRCKIICKRLKSVIKAVISYLANSENDLSTRGRHVECGLYQASLRFGDCGKLGTNTSKYFRSQVSSLTHVTELLGTIGSVMLGYLSLDIIFSSKLSVLGRILSAAQTLSIYNRAAAT